MTGQADRGEIELAQTQTAGPTHPDTVAETVVARLGPGATVARRPRELPSFDGNTRVFLQRRVANAGLLGGGLALSALAFRAVFTVLETGPAGLLEPMHGMHLLSGLAFLS